MKTIIKVKTAIMLASSLMMGAYAGTKSEPTFNDKQINDIEKIVRNYLLKNPSLLIEMSQELEKQMAQYKSKVLSDTQNLIFNNPQYPTMGNPNGTVVIAEFTDYQCGYCKRMYPILKEAIKKHKDLKIIMIDFPALGEVSLFASRIALAAHKQGRYADVHDALMKHRGRLSQNKIISIANDLGLDMEKLKSDANSDFVRNTIATTMSLVKQLNITGTPTIIGKGTTKFTPGLLDKDRLEKLINTVRENSK